MLHTRTLSRAVPNILKSRSITPTRTFYPSAAKMVKVGDSIPSIELYETTPGTKVDLSQELKGKGLIIGVPAAFSTHNRFCAGSEC